MTTNRQNTLDIRLPEGVVFSLPLAGPSTRFAAWLIDCMMGFAITIVFSMLAGGYLRLLGDTGLFIQVIAIFAIPILYGVLLEGFWGGQTLGKRLFRLRVMDASGLRLEFRQVFLRNILRPVDALPIFYLVGGAVSLLTSRVQRLGDLAADTVVVRHLPVAAPDLTQLAAGKYNTLRDHPVLAARLRQRIPAIEAGVALQAVLRRGTLEPAARLALFAQIATRFRAAVPLPDELAEDLTDEQYVRNVLDVLFRAKVGPNAQPV